jgi:hypothetical protein
VNSGEVDVNGNTIFNGTLTNASGALVKIVPDGSTGTATLTLPGDFTNDGQILLTSTVGGYPAALKLASGTLTNSSTGSILTAVGAGGTRTINGNVVNNGNVSIAEGGVGQLTIKGNFQNSGLVSLELHGVTAGSFSQLIVQSPGGGAILAGTLSVTAVGFTPVTGNSFQLMTYAGASGDFESYILPGDPATWTHTAGATSLVLSRY